MKRNARLYYINHKQWQPIVDMIENHKNYTMKSMITIFDAFGSFPNHIHLGILSLHEEVDKIIESYGGKDVIEATPEDLYRNELQNYSGTILYGNKSNFIYLPKAT